MAGLIISAVIFVLILFVLVAPIGILSKALNTIGNGIQSVVAAILRLFGKKQ